MSPGVSGPDVHANGNTSSKATPDVHATGTPDTPVEVLTDLLSKAAKEEDVEQLRLLVQHAHKLVAGLDPYLEDISTPPSDVRILTLLSCGQLQSALLCERIGMLCRICLAAL